MTYRVKTGCFVLGCGISPSSSTPLLRKKELESWGFKDISAANNDPAINARLMNNGYSISNRVALSPSYIFGTQSSAIITISIRQGYGYGAATNPAANAEEEKYRGLYSGFPFQLQIFLINATKPPIDFCYLDKRLLNFNINIDDYPITGNSNPGSAGTTNENGGNINAVDYRLIYHNSYTYSTWGAAANDFHRTKYETADLKTRCLAINRISDLRWVDNSLNLENFRYACIALENLYAGRNQNQYSIGPIYVSSYSFLLIRSMFGEYNVTFKAERVKN